MKISKIKKLNDIIPYCLKKPFTKMIRERLINNAKFKTTYEKLIKADGLSNSEILEKQFKELKKTLIHAYNETEYYHKLFDECHFDPFSINSVDEIQRLPILTREDIKHFSPQLEAKDVYDYYSVSTGGTSGGAIDVSMSKNAIYKEWAFVYHYWSKFGYDYRHSKLATFRGVELGNAISTINPLYSEIRLNPFIMSRDNIQEYNKNIDDYGASFIYGYPSSIYNYCKLTEEAGLYVKGKYHAAFIISENLYKFQEETITRVLGCPIAMFYGHSERAVFAELYDGAYSFNSLYGFTEISPEGNPIVTGFINSRMPLIRYELDDSVININEEESRNHDLTYEIVDNKKKYLIIGHKDSEVIYGKNGEYYVGVEALDFHGLLTTNFAGIQLAQNTPGELIIKYVNNGDITQDDLKKIERKCRSRLGESFSFVFEPVEKIQLTPRGKFKLLIQSINPEKK